MNSCCQKRILNKYYENYRKLQLNCNKKLLLLYSASCNFHIASYAVFTAFKGGN